MFSSVELYYVVDVEQNTVSNKSLMEMPKDLVKDAVTVRKSLLGYMGDKQMSFPETLAQNILMKGLDKPKIRDEVYLSVEILFSYGRGWTIVPLSSKVYVTPLLYKSDFLVDVRGM